MLSWESLYDLLESVDGAWICFGDSMWWSIQALKKGGEWDVLLRLTI
jgi:hypothetical protein